VGGQILQGITDASASFDERKNNIIMACGGGVAIEVGHDDARDPACLLVEDRCADIGNPNNIVTRRY